MVQSRHNIFLVFVFLFLSFQISAQHEADFWYFGNYAGLDFSSGNPEPKTDGQLSNYEGCATISDSTGNLLFYTNGVTVWNKNHQILTNGEGLTGDTSSTQSALIVPQPANDSIYYIFTTDELSVDTNGNITEHDGFRYSLVNMNKNNGDGEIIIKNVLLSDSVCEKLTAVRHQNNKDIWIITHNFGGNQFYAWLLTDTGLGTTPFISTTFFDYVIKETAVGYLKAAPDGNTLASNPFAASRVEVYNFDKLNGTITDYFYIDLDSYTYAYGCEFSPDGSKLYYAVQKKIYQIDLDAGSVADIINSEVEIAETDLDIGALQLSDNGKLYISCNTSEYLHVIHKPDSLFPNCLFEENEIFLDGRSAGLGLPNFMTSYFSENKFDVLNTCLHSLTEFHIQNISEIDSVYWNFDDSESGIYNHSSELSPIHIFSNEGIYDVSLKIWYHSTLTEYFRRIKIVPLPQINLGVDTLICNSDSYVLSAMNEHLTYRWNNLSVEPTLTITNSGTYWVDVKNLYTGCENSDTISVVFSLIPEIELGHDTSFCEQTEFYIDAYHENYSYIWQDSSINYWFYADEAGTYYVDVFNEDGCQNSDTIRLSIKDLPRFNFSNDTVFCEGTNYVLMPVLDTDTEFLWNDGSILPSCLIETNGLYKLIAANRCGIWSDSITVIFKYCGAIVIPNVFTPNGDEFNNLFYIKGIEEGLWNLKIYNRWGQSVNEFDEYKNNWDGTDFKEHKLSAAVYYYILSNPQSAEIYRGTVRIFR